MRVPLLVLWFTLSTALGAEQCGPLVCFHDSVCAPGAPDLSDLPDSASGAFMNIPGGLNQHCECTAGFTGIDCSIPAENCGNSVTQRCLHGGVCYTEDTQSGPYCDCSNAVDLETETHYVGQWCEQEVPHEDDRDSYCNHVQNPNTFCLNGGSCNDQFPGSSPYPCLCVDGYRGAHCELPPSASSVRDCNLNCANGGYCQLGEKMDMSSVEHHHTSSEATANLDANDNPMPDNLNDHMHCECPDGFYGPLCEKQVTTTECENFTCLNGGLCTVKADPLTGDQVPVCDCTPTYNEGIESFFAGQYCQSPSNDYCGLVNNEYYFCSNFGTCKDANDPTAGCNCPPGTAGPHCEYIEKYDCTLTCMNGGSCTIGNPPEAHDYNLSLDNQHHHAYQYCDCPSGYSGSNCEVTQDNACGDSGFGCLNGGTCQEQPNGEFKCDCLAAQSPDGSILYDGKHCQYPSTVICLQDVIQEEIYFCTNNGQCQHPHTAGCLCPEGFGGFSCEFTLDDCTLDCQNGGECMLGSPPDTSYLNAYWFNPDDYANWQYCSCPDGTTGELCEIGAPETHNACPGTDFACLNGGTCLDVNGDRLKSRCNCEGADAEVDGETVYYDGLYCQFPSTSYCGVTEGDVFFCTNGGECPPDYDLTRGCKCPEGFAGIFCELVEGVDCTLDCGENGICRLGAPPSGSHAHAYWYDQNALEDYQYCECINGAGGEKCDKFGEDCGDFTCLNGGSCNDQHGNPMPDRCNCLPAWSPGSPNVYYDGRFCQYASTSICKEDDDEVYFCMNGGRCPAQGREGIDPCDCDPGFSGFSCEFIEGTDCTLDCGDHGECRLGNPPGTSPSHAYWFDPDAQDNYQYCHCKDGYGGQYCDQQGEDCGSFTCLNGGRCEDRDGKEMVDRCDCIPAWESGNPNVYYDGRFCQYASTSVCKETPDESYFCMNGGTCPDQDRVGTDPCVCPPGYAGFSCEFLEGTDCNLNCGTHGKCRLGAPPGGSHAHAYWFDPDSEENYQYCECEGSWGGKFCEFEGQDCGDFTCLNGGECDPNEPDRCNCIPGYEPGQGDIRSIYYDGRFCQYASTSICYEDEHQGFFCTNNGSCRPGLTDPCSCPDGFTGHSCEFIEGTDCTLECQNGGSCRLGTPPGTDFMHAYWYDADSQDNYQYCDCPTGYGGQYCETAQTNCGQFTCLNGGSCLTESGKNIGRCDCVGAYDDNSGTYFDGLFCQYASTSVCYEDDTDAFFCMNGGICQDDFSLGCICPEGFGGFYCELRYPQDCRLPCFNGGECVLGSPPGISMEDAYWNNEDMAGEYQFCRCPDGYHGPLCENQGQEKCGEHECHNGATCVSREIDGTTVHHCDCRTADHDGKYYAGTYCQYEATDICKEDDAGAFFCVNNGDCQDDFRSGCQCPEGTRGFSCEFVLSDGVETSSGGTAQNQDTIVDSQEDTVCILDCHDHGTCKHGIKNITDIGDAANAEHLSYTHDDFQHCVCDEGWVGIYCDQEIKQCSGTDHFCLHGSECVPGEQECDCTAADSPIAENFAGDNCEHVADVCHTDGDDSNPQSYCANGGTCLAYNDDKGDPHPGCACPEGFTGQKCEITLNKADAKDPDDSVVTKKSSSSGSLQGLGIAAIVLSVCAVLAVALFVINNCVKRKRFRRRSGESSGLIWAGKGGYKDNAETINFSPHKGEDYMASFANPSRDPMVTPLAPDMTEADAVASDTSTGRAESDDEPQVFIGPPTDEDGHVLHSVDII